MTKQQKRILYYKRYFAKKYPLARNRSLVLLVATNTSQIVELKQLIRRLDYDKHIH